MKEGETIYFIDKCELWGKLEALRISYLEDYEKCLDCKQSESVKKMADVYMSLSSGVAAAREALEEVKQYKARFTEEEEHFYK